MPNHNKWTVESAQEADKNGTLREWLIKYLHREGTNEKLANAIKDLPETMTIGSPKIMPLDKMKLMVGAEGSNRKWIDTDWKENIKKFVELIQQGWSPPPIILTDYWGEKHSITDGNHRYEALKQLGHKEYWAIQLRNIK